MRFSNPETWAYLLGGTSTAAILVGLAIGHRGVVSFGVSGVALVVGLFYSYVLVGAAVLLLRERGRSKR